MATIDLPQNKGATIPRKEIQEINSWFYNGKKITLLLNEKDCCPEIEEYDYHTKQKKISVGYSSLEEIQKLEPRIIDIYDYALYLKSSLPLPVENIYELVRARVPILTFNNYNYEFNLYSVNDDENISKIWKVFDKTLNISHLVPFDKTYVFNDKLHVPYNADKLGGYSSIFKTKNQIKDFLSIANFNYRKKENDEIISYFKDCKIETVEKDGKDANKITGIFLKKNIAPSKFEIANPDSPCIVDSDNWIVTLAAIDDCSYLIPIDKHGSIIIEGIENNKYFMKMLHIGGNPLSRNSEAEVRINLINPFSTFKSSKYVKSWQTSSYEARKLINLVSWEIEQQEAKNHQVYFNLLGSGGSKESLARHFFTKEKKLEDDDAVKQTIINYYKEKKKIMNQNERFIVLIIRSKDGFIQTLSFPETSSWKNFDTEERGYNDEDIKVIERNNFEKYSPQFTELIFKQVKDHWEQKIAPDNCITWAIKKLREIGIYIDKKNITSTKKTLGENIQALEFSLDSILDIVVNKTITLWPSLQLSSDNIFKNVPPLLLVLFKESFLEKNFDKINFIVETLGNMGLFHEAYELLTLCKIEFGNIPTIDEIQQNLTDLAPRADHKMFLLKRLLQNQADQLEKHIKKDPDNTILSLFKSFLSLQKETLDLLEKKKDLTLVMNSAKEAFQKLSQATYLLQKNYTDLQYDLLNAKSFTEALFLNLSSDFKNQKDGDGIVERLKMELGDENPRLQEFNESLKKIKSDEKERPLVIKEFVEKLNKSLGIFVKEYGTIDLQEILTSFEQLEHEIETSSIDSKDLDTYIIKFEEGFQKLEKELEVIRDLYNSQLDPLIIESTFTEIDMLFYSDNPEDQKKALPTFKEALQKSLTNYGDKHLELITQKLISGTKYFDMYGLSREKLEIFKDVNEILQSKYEGRCTEYLLQEMVQLYNTDDVEIKEQVRSEIKKMIGNSLQNNKKTFEDVDTQFKISFLLFLGKISASLDLNKKALHLYTQTFELYQKEDGDKGILEADLRYGLAKLMHLAGQKQAARKMLEKSFDIYKSLFPDGNTKVIEVLEELVALLIELKEPKKAIAKYDELISMSKKVYGENHHLIREIKQRFQKFDSCTIL